MEYCWADTLGNFYKRGDIFKLFFCLFVWLLEFFKFLFSCAKDWTFVWNSHVGIVICDISELHLQYAHILESMLKAECWSSVSAHKSCWGKKRLWSHIDCLLFWSSRKAIMNLKWMNWTVTLLQSWTAQALETFIILENIAVFSRALYIG